VANVAARSKQSLCNKVEGCILNSRLECMLGVVAMFHTNMARDAEVVVGAGSASDKVLLG
jgi:hypothetical protein